MKILVTGGAGYIGSHTLVELINHGGFEIISADNFSNSQPDTFDRVKEITGKSIKNYDIDLSDPVATHQMLSENQDLSGIIHFAALKAVGESVEKPLLYYRTNLNSLINLLNGCREFNISNFIFSSSCTVYGESPTLPVTEETPTGNIQSPYGNTKMIGEDILRDFSKSNEGFSGIALRYFNPVGAHMSGLIGELPLGTPNNLIPRITQTAAGLSEQMHVFGNDYETRDGTCIRDYVHVSDIAQAHVLAMSQLLDKNISDPFSIFNLGTGAGCTVLEMIEAFEKATGEKLNYKISARRPGDVTAIYSNCQKAKEVLNWEPQHDLEEMMASAWKWQVNLGKG